MGVFAGDRSLHMLCRSSRFLLLCALLAQSCCALQLVNGLHSVISTSPERMPRAAHARAQFGGNEEQQGLTRDAEPDEYFSTNMDKMSDSEKLKSPVVIGGVAIIVLPFVVGMIALFASQ